MTPVVSVVVPVFNGAATVGDCVRSLAGQSLDAERYEVIVVDDGSADDSAAVAREAGATTVVRRPHEGRCAARNAGWQAASAPWVAFVDADGVPARTWLAALVDRVSASGERVLGAAGLTLGHGSSTPPARYCDLVGSLDAERHLAHPVFPFPPSCNVVYRRSALAEVGGFDERYVSYEACDLHTRLLRAAPARSRSSRGRWCCTGTGPHGPRSGASRCRTGGGTASSCCTTASVGRPAGSSARGRRWRGSPSPPAVAMGTTRWCVGGLS